MRVSRSNRRPAERVARILASGWIMLVAAPAAAQQPGPPIPLIPPPPAISPNLLPPPSSRDDAVASESLAPPAVGWDSATPPRDPLPQAFWHGTSRTMAELLLARLPDTTSPALQSLERRLLLSPAAAPEGPNAGDRDLTALRAAALLRLGEIEAARAVIAAIPDRERGRALPLIVAGDAIGGDVAGACATVRETVRRDQAAFWQTALIACQALQGETEQARLGLQLLAEEQQGPRDEILARAVEAVAGGPPALIARPETLDPLMLRLLVAGYRSLAPEVVDALRPDLALCLALDDEAPAATRLAAAERAARYGALSPDRLRALYSALTVADERGDAPALNHSRRLAEIGRPGTAAERVARITRFADAFASPQEGGFGLAARLVLPALLEIEPDSSVAGAAPLVARLLIAAGDGRAARRWSKLVSGSEEPSLCLLLAFAAPREELVSDQTGAPLPPLYVMLASALGEPLAPADWARLPAAAWTVAGPPAPPPAAWLDLAEAVRAKRIGETALAAIMVASPAGALSADPVALSAAVSGLRQAGFAADARRLAVEAALAAGL